MNKPTRNRLISLVLPALLLTAGCSETTWWDGQGSWTGQVILPGAAQTTGTGSVSDPTAGSDGDRIDLCVLSAMELGLGFVPIQGDGPAAIKVRAARPLCQEGRSQITGGDVLIWGNMSGDPNVLAAARQEGWTVGGEIQVTRYLNQELPDLDAGERADTELIEGTLTVTANGPAGAVIQITGATFRLTVTASRVKISFS